MKMRIEGSLRASLFCFELNNLKLTPRIVDLQRGRNVINKLLLHVVEDLPHKIYVAFNGNSAPARHR